MSGKWIVAGMLMAALIAFGGAVLVQRIYAQRAVEFWGIEAARLTKQGRSVTAMRLGEELPGADAEGLRTPDGVLAIVETKDVSRAGGLLHMRSGLMQDAAYDWDAVINPHQTWRYALAFSDGRSEFTYLLTEDCMTIGSRDGDRLLRMQPIEKTTRSPLRAFVEEQFAR